MKILVTNDDGVRAPGIAALADALDTLGEVEVVGPSEGQSGAGHGITFLEPLTAERVSIGASRQAWSVAGTPADCVKLGINELLPSAPDLVVSGINAGANRGVDVLYSGTVAAAAEAALMGIPSVAVSLEAADTFDFKGAGAWALRVVAPVLPLGMPKGTMLNINVPAASRVEARGIRLVPQSLLAWEDSYQRRQDPRGRDYYWLSGAVPAPDTGNLTDLRALEEGWVTVTPLQFDLMNHARMNVWRDLWTI